METMSDLSMLLERQAAGQTKAVCRRRTLAHTIDLSGVGLHSGEIVHLRCEPAPAGSGLVFRHNKASNGEIPVSPFHVAETVNAVTLANRSWRVQTVEHLLAALAALRITDLYLFLDAQEIPIMDGSAAEFYAAFASAGIVELDEELSPIQLKNPAWVVDGNKYLVALPHDGLRISYTIDFNHPDLRGQSMTMDLDDETIAREILPARTFGFLRDVEALKARGLIKGASAENAVVLTDDGYLNERRFPEECVRHKALDLIGDLYLLARPVEAHFIAHRAGHAMDVALARKIQMQAAMDELGRRKLERR